MIENAKSEDKEEIYNLICILENKEINKEHFDCVFENSLKDEDIIYLVYRDEKIEGFLRSIMFKILYGKEEEIKDIIVTDLNSKDKTKEIIEKMAKDYEYLKVSNWKECKDIIDSIDNN